MHISVLGCGPAGLLSAHAAKLAGHAVQIVSVEAKPSRMGGAQYLHTHIDEITSTTPETHILVAKEGSREGYAKKVYGNPEAPVSWDRYQAYKWIPGWNLFDAYDRLWQTYGDDVYEQEITAESWQGATDGSDLVISTIPRNVLCTNPDEHKFHQQQIWAAPIVVADNGEEDFILYNGMPDLSFYRTSHLFGQSMTEWSTVGFNKDDPPCKEAFMINKPLATNCDCWVGEIAFVGRYGAWDKEQLVSDAWEDVASALF